MIVSSCSRITFQGTDGKPDYTLAVQVIQYISIRLTEQCSLRSILVLSLILVQICLLSSQIRCQNRATPPSLDTFTLFVYQPPCVILLHGYSQYVVLVRRDPPTRCSLLHTLDCPDGDVKLAGFDAYVTDSRESVPLKHG